MAVLLSLLIVDTGEIYGWLFTQAVKYQKVLEQALRICRELCCVYALLYIEQPIFLRRCVAALSIVQILAEVGNFQLPPFVLIPRYLKATVNRFSEDAHSNLPLRQHSRPRDRLSQPHKRLA